MAKASNGSAIVGAIVVAKFGGTMSDDASGTFVSRRTTDAHGVVEFVGWAGRAKLVPHHVWVFAEGYTTRAATLHLVPSKHVSITVELSQCSGV
jgi:hypothetical protein